MQHLNTEHNFPHHSPYMLIITHDHNRYKTRRKYYWDLNTFESRTQLPSSLTIHVNNNTQSQRSQSIQTQRRYCWDHKCSVKLLIVKSIWPLNWDCLHSSLNKCTGDCYKRFITCTSFLSCHTYIKALYTHGASYTVKW